jgi:hypothetical protein
MVEVQGTLANSLGGGVGREAEKDKVDKSKGEISGNWWRKDAESKISAGDEGNKENHEAQEEASKTSAVKDVEMEGSTNGVQDEAKKTE